MQESIEEVRVDTVKTGLIIRNGADWCGAKDIDVLLYGSSDQQLETHIRLKTENPMAQSWESVLESTAGSKECLVVANSTKDLDLKIMSKLSTAEALTFAYEDEDTQYPVMVGRATLTAGADTLVTLTPFLCRVIVEEVSNSMDGWVLMEEPEVYLSDINPEVGIFQEQDFRPSATKEEGPYATLPCDIGYFPQYPGTVLHCYPNDTPERVLGGWRTKLSFRCKVEGEVIEQTAALPAFGRNSVTRVRIRLSETKELIFKF